MHEPPAVISDRANHHVEILLPVVNAIMTDDDFVKLGP